MSTVIVFVEHAAGAPRRASLEALGAARSVGAQAVAVLCGEGAAAAAAQLSGVAKAIALTGDACASSDAVAAEVAALVREEGGKGFLAAATSAGKDLAPRVAAHLDATLFSDCTALAAAGDSFQVTRPWLAGKAIAQLTSSASVLCATLRLNVFPAEAAGGGASVAERAVSAAPKARVVSVESKGESKLDVKEAPVVVAGGRGLKDAEGFGILESLAAAFGDAAVGASRAVVDLGWRPHGEQVGQTGKTVSPPLYFAVGISGAIQHLAGMRTARTIVAINKDPEAPIFKVADYGIVGDAFEIVPAITEAVKAIKAQG